MCLPKVQQFLSYVEYRGTYVHIRTILSLFMAPENFPLFSVIRRRKSFFKSLLVLLLINLTFNSLLLSESPS